MHDPIAAGRRSALKAVTIQVIVVALVALAFLAQGPRHALGAAAGGVVMALGNALAARTALGGIVPASTAFGQLLLGELWKWAIVVAGIWMALAVWRLPPLPTLVGLAAGVLAYLLALNICSRTKREP